MKDVLKNDAYVAALIFITALAASCDTVQPSRVGTLVLEAYVKADERPPDVRLTKTSYTSTPLESVSPGVSNAFVELVVNGETIVYEPVADSSGLYRPAFSANEFIVPPLARFMLTARDGANEVTASGTVPPPIRLVDVLVEVPDRATEAVLVDTLDIGLDSLDLALNAQQGFIFPVQVSLTWRKTTMDGPTDYWVETRLEPVTKFSSSIVDFFLLPRQVIPEADLLPDEAGNVVWSGVYAVPVDASDAPLPEHALDISLLRGEASFALFETSRDNPSRREPVSNVTGGLGFVGGLSIDTWRVDVER